MPQPMSYPSLSAIRLIWKYQQANDNNVAIIAKKRRVNLFYKRKLKCMEGKETFDSNKKKVKARKNAIEQTFLTIVRCNPQE